MGTSLICFAVAEEARFFRAFAAARPDLVVLITGMGAQNSARSLRAALERKRPEQVLTCGFAGGLDPALRSGDVIFDADADLPLNAALLKAGARRVRFHCAERVLTTVAEKTQARHATGADAVEMESSVIRAACRAAGIPSATVRVISDAADEALPLDFNRLLTADQKIHFGRLALALIRSPGKIPALLRLQRRTRNAAGQLTRVLAEVLGGSAS